MDHIETRAADPIGSASRYPRIKDGTLVVAGTVRAPAGMRFPRQPHLSYRLLSKDAEPPKVGKAFVSLTPQVDSDGNDVAGVRMPEVEVPLAVYTGWNFRSPAIGQPEETLGGAGSFFPFSKEKIAARYVNLEKYLERFEAAARKLASEGYLLEDDIGELKKAAVLRWNWITQNASLSRR